ncbi:probable serine/threonine-protein kinase DDB_G0288147 [Bradysia coprophila]|uniref:probable serine/threonine-protein kinase DDB_G0288147 n=1 Tax=Bradysia coprophila TaxID=38358 RepID=UPI00187D8831|nr:probable serine/threonine-protein kinase DDB_G0288147 [Bradysia coprophila]
MWTELQNSAMMGLQATATKRKYEVGVCGNAGDVQANCTPAKASRWSTMSTITNSRNINKFQAPSAEDSIAKLEAVVAVPSELWSAEPIVDSISRLQAVAVPDTWGSDSTRSALATTLLNADDLEEDDDDFEDDFDEEDSIIPSYSPIRYPSSPPRGYMPPGYPKPNYYSEPYPQQNCSRTPSHYARAGHYTWNNNGYYIPPEAASPQQTIRCAENGKSYLELGSGSYGSVDSRHPKRCCDGRGNWCNSKQCYRDRRLKMRNLSMFKLSRFRQVSEQSLYRSVLICNTLKSIDREIEHESKESSPNNASEFHQNHYNNSKLINNNAQNELHSNQPNQYSSSDNSNSNFNQPSFNSSSINNNNRLASSVTTIVSLNESITPYDPLKEAQSGRATPFPLSGDTDSGFGDEDCTRPINWGSVLSLSSQSALDPLNNNDLFTTQTTSMAITQSSTTTTLTGSSSTTNWEYNLLDMDLGLGPELTELLPSWKLTPLSADDILKSVSPPLEPSKVMLESEIDSFTHIMVGS